jgi:hypothetical protein
LRFEERLVLRSEQTFIDPYEKYESSSNDSSEMFQSWRKHKAEALMEKQKRKNLEKKPEIVANVEEMKI